MSIGIGNTPPSGGYGNVSDSQPNSAPSQRPLERRDSGVDFSTPSERAAALSQKQQETPPEGQGKDGFKGFMGKVAEKTWMIPGLSNTAGGISKSEGGVAGGIVGAGKGVGTTLGNNVKGLVDSVKDGSIPTSPLKAGVACYKGNIANSEYAPETAKNLAG